MLRLRGQRVPNSSLLLLCGQIHIFARSLGTLARVEFWGLGLYGEWCCLSMAHMAIVEVNDTDPDRVELENHWKNEHFQIPKHRICKRDLFDGINRVEGWADPE